MSKNIKKRRYTFASGCQNIPNQQACTKAGGTHGYSCVWKNGRCASLESFVPAGQPVQDPCSVHTKPMTCDGMFNFSRDCQWGYAPTGKLGCFTRPGIEICESAGKHHYDVDHCGLLPAMIIPRDVDPRNPNTAAAKLATNVCNTFYANPDIGDAHVCRFDIRQEPKDIVKDGKRTQYWTCTNGQRCNPP